MLHGLVPHYAEHPTLRNTRPGTRVGALQNDDNRQLIPITTEYSPDEAALRTAGWATRVSRGQGWR